jgi:hypothetical protein
MAEAASRKTKTTVASVCSLRAPVRQANAALQSWEDPIPLARRMICDTPSSQNPDGSQFSKVAGRGYTIPAHTRSSAFLSRKAATNR